jgi:UDP-N-acetylmuramoyl-tripeptide--D-alanyl-D-alanine ligase
MELTLREILEISGGRLLQAVDLKIKPARFCIDSREVCHGDFFVPLPGARTDGHNYLAEAALRGAAGCFVAAALQVSLPPGMAVIAVDNTLTAMQQVAAGHREKFSLPIIAVTGSNGKTTTKDLLAAALSVWGPVLHTEGNLNNHLGVPLMLSRLEKGHRAAILEMGMRGFGEIDLLARLSRPEIAIITNIGEAHLASMGSRENIACAKAEVLRYLPPNGVAILNGDEPLLVPYFCRLNCRLITFGFSRTSDIRCEALTRQGAVYHLRLEQEGYAPLQFVSPLPGKHNVYNVLAAVAAARVLGLADAGIVSGLSAVRPSGMRLEVTELPQGWKVLNDAYNASPTSMIASLRTFAEMADEAGKIAVLGDMLELGAFEEEGHRLVGRSAAQTGLKALIIVGERAEAIAAGAGEAGFAKEGIHLCRTPPEAASMVRQVAGEGDWILLKGSRGMRMEQVLEELVKGERS